FSALVALSAAVSSYDFQIRLQLGDLARHFAPVDFKLCFTGTAQTDSGCRTFAATLSRKMSPLARKAWQTVFVLGEFDLKRALPRLRVLGKNVEDQRRAIDDLDVFNCRSETLL